MPNIPFFPTDQAVQPAPSGATVDPRAYGAPGQALAGAASEVGGLADQWAQRYAEARRQAAAGTLEQQASSQAMTLAYQQSKLPDAQAAFDGFNQQFGQISKATLAQTKDPLVQSYLTQRLGEMGITLGQSVRQTAFHQESSARVGDLDAQQAQVLEQLRGTADPNVRAMLMDQYLGNVRGAQAAHWIDGAQSAQMQLGFRAGAAEMDAYRDAVTDPVGTRDRLLGDGYPGLPGPRRDLLLMHINPRANAVQADGIVNRILPLSAGAGGVPAQFAGLAERAVAGTNVPPEIANALWQHESAFNPNAVSSKGAIGLGQVMPATAQAPGMGLAPLDPARLTDPEANAHFSMQYLNALGVKHGVTDWHDPKQVTPALKDYYGSQGPDGDKYAQDVLALAMPRTGSTMPDEAALLDRGLQAAGSDPELQQQVIGKLRARVGLLRAQTSGERAQLGHDLADTQAALLAGVDAPIPEQRIRALLAPDQAAATLHDLLVAQAGGQVVKSMQWATPEEAQAAQADLQSGTGAVSTLLRLKLQKAALAGGAVAAAPGSADTVREHRTLADEAARAFAARTAALTADPAGYAAQNPDIAQLAQAIDPANPQTFESYATRTVALQRHLGVAEGDTRVLGVRQAQAMAQQLTTADPGSVDAGAQLDRMAQSYGQAWPAVWHDLVRDGHLSPSWQVLGSMAAGPQRTALQRALQTEAQKGGAEQMRTAIGPAAAQTIEAGLPGVLEDFQHTVAIPGLSSDPATFEAVQSAVQTLARANVFNGQPAGVALDNAAAAVLNYDWEGRARAPRGQGALASRTAATLLDGLKPDDLAAAGGGAGMAADDRQSAYLRAVQRGGQWVTNERGDGWVLAVQGNDGSWQMPLKRDGSRIGFRFRDMPANGPQGAASGASGALPGMAAPGMTMPSFGGPN